MAKYIYKIVILFFIFLGSTAFFTMNQGSGMIDSGKTIDVTSESYPVLTTSTGGNQINTLYGYSGSMDPAIVRLSITPLDTTKKMAVNIAGGTMVIQKVKYQILDKETEEIYEEKELNALSDQAKKIDFTFDYAFDTSQEYIFALTATTDTGRKIHYYTRLKYYTSDTHLADKLAFAKKFHDDTFHKDNDRQLRGYLEPDASEPNDTLASVNIHSDVDLVTWGKLSPEVISDIVPTVKEFNTETACIWMNYYVKGTTSSGTEIFHVKEFYRVRYSGGRSYLLGFQRTMEATFDEKMASVNKNQLKLGITQDTDMDLLTSEDGKMLYFARNGILYRYDMNKGQNKLHEVYRHFTKDAADIYTLNDENAIRINKLDEDGNLYFTVYGYIARGQYEGKVAVVLYRYNAADDKLEEVVYLPMDSTYQQLKEDFNPYSYVNSNNVYYLIVGNIIYSYNIQARRLDVIAENVKNSSFAVMKKKNCVALSSNLKTGYSDLITIYNLETDAKTELKAPSSDEYIRLLGTIDSNLVYGYVRKSEVKVNKDGSRLVPCYRMEIADNEGKVLKTYNRRNIYISSVTVNGNVLTMNRYRKNQDGYDKISTDSILNQESQEKAKVSLASRVTASTLTEWYITLPTSFIMTRTPTRVFGASTVLSSQRAVHLESTGITKYYVYALGGITSSYENAGTAIRVADEQMGTVISSHHQVVWERGGSFLMNRVAGINLQKTGDGISSIGACAHMVLKANHYSVDAKELTATGKSVYGMLDKYMDRPVNLSGVNLEQALYFVSGGKPVIAMTGDSSAVVISGYDQSTITILNPNTGKEENVGRKQAEDIFKAAGNHFISYMS